MKQRFTRSPFSRKGISFVSSFAILGVWLMANLPAGAQDVCMLIPLPLEERMQTADLVVEVKVISQRSFWDSRHENIYTASQVEVYKVFKGVSPQGTIEVITEGGRVGLDLHILSNTLQLQPQQQGVLFLQKDKNYSGSAQYSVFGSLQGFIRYQVTDGTARDPFQRYASIPAQLYPTLTQLPGASLKTIKPNVELETALKRTNEVPAPTQRRAIPLITDFTPKSLRAGTGDVLTIRGTNFGATRGNGYVEFKNADDGGESYIKPLPTDYVSWTDTEIKVKVPTSGIDQGTAGTGTFRVVNNDPNTATSALELTIVFAYLNVTYEDAQYNIVEQSFQPVLIDQNGEGGYTFRFGASFESNRPALYSFKRAMNEWSCHTLINWNVASNRAVARATDDQINAVVFAAAGDIPANVLGRTTSRYKGCIQGANVTFYVSEIDMEFAQRNDWQYGPEQPTRLQYDFTSVAVHELGHGHQLSHLILPRAIMHYGVGRGQAARELNPENDIAGGNFVMARSTVPNLCQVAPMKPKPVNACAILVERLVLQGEYQSATNTVLLQWETEQENNLLRFVVERSTNGVDFTPIGEVPANGTTTAPRTYQFTDTSPVPTLAYYRLQLVKSTGANEFSEDIEISGPSFRRLLSPNPGGQQTVLYFDTPAASELEIGVFDTSGRQFAAFTINVVPEVKRYDLTLPDLPRGLFLIRWQSKQEQGVLRYLKVE